MCCVLRYSATEDKCNKRDNWSKNKSFKKIINKRVDKIEVLRKC